MDILLKKFHQCIESQLGEGFLKVLLEVMSIAFKFPHLKDNIKGFNARYVFKAQDQSIHAAAIFEHDAMEVKDDPTAVPNPNLTITFRNSQALMNLLLAKDPDILNAMLHQDVQLEGNLNYLYKFAYMARHLQLLAAKAV